jgi:hypothetical protein
MYIGLRVKYRYCCEILMKLEISRQIFEKYSNVRFHVNPFIESRVISCGRTDGQRGRRTDRQRDRHDEANSRSSQFGESAQQTDFARCR